MQKPTFRTRSYLRHSRTGTQKIKLPFVFLHLSGLVTWLVRSKPIRADNYQCLQSGLPYRILVVRFPSDWLECSSLKPNQQCERTKWRKWNNGDREEARNCVTNEDEVRSRTSVQQMSLFRRGFGLLCFSGYNTCYHFVMGFYSGNTTSVLRLPFYKWTLLCLCMLCTIVSTSRPLGGANCVRTAS